MCSIPQYTNYYEKSLIEPVFNELFIFGAYKVKLSETQLPAVVRGNRIPEEK
jgi:hypothetical protein